MIKKNRIYLSIILMFVADFSIAQSSMMTIDHAVELALKNNYDILIAKNNSSEASNNNTLGNSGMLPVVSLNASESSASNDTKQEFSSGLSVDKKGVKSENITTGAYLSWTIFDGLKMFATRERLKELEGMGMIDIKVQVENTMVKVISAYYNIVMQKQMINGLKASMAVSEERLKIAQKKFDVGTASKVDVLQAKLDFNAQKSALMKENTLLADYKEDLNQLLVQPVEQDFEVTDSIPLMNEYKYEDLKNSIEGKNSDLLFAQKNVDISRYMIKEAKSTFYPKLNLNVNYIFSRAQNQAGFALLNQNLGFNYGFTASWTIFNGFNNANNIKNLKLNLENSNFEYQSLKAQTQLSLLKIFKRYQDDIAILQLEDENNKLAKENLDIALERFKVGESNSIELKTAQQSFEDALNRLSDARFSAKVSETQLLKLTGGIVK
jgi:outer membrane protein